jgi:hypothetical protein
MKKVLFVISLIFSLYSVYPSAIYTGENFRYVINNDAESTITILEYIGNHRKVTIPSYLDGRKVVAIEGIPFYNEQRLEWLSFPPTVKKIGPSIITDCDNLRDIWFLGNAPSCYTMPQIYGHPDLTITRMAHSEGFTDQWSSYPVIISYTEPPDYANPLISSDGKWEYSISGGEAVLITYLGDEEVLIIPQVLHNYPVTHIASTSFDDFFITGLIKKIIIPDSIRTLDPGLFNKLFWIKDVSLGNGISIIPEGAFEGCVSLENIFFGNNVKEIGDRAFSNCLMLEQVILPESIRYIKDEAFAYDESLAMVSIGKNIQSLGNRVFIGCEGLIEVRFRYTQLPSAGVELFPTNLRTLFISYDGKGKQVPSIYHNVLTKPYYHVIYSSGTNIPVTDPNCYFTNDEAIIKDGPNEKIKREFLGWDTHENGNGIRYEPGDCIVIESSSITLYPQFGDSIYEEEGDMKPVQASSYSGRWDTDWGEFNIVEERGRIRGVEVDNPTSFLEGTISRGICTGSFGEIVKKKKIIFGSFSFTRNGDFFTGYRCDVFGMPLYMCDQWNGVCLK